MDINNKTKKASKLKRKSTPHKSHRTIDSEEKVTRCLTCTKPASACKGNCWGNY